MHYEKIIRFLSVVVVFVLLLSAGVRELQTSKPEIHLPSIDLTSNQTQSDTQTQSKPKTLSDVLTFTPKTDSTNEKPITWKDFKSAGFAIRYPEGFTINTKYKNTTVAFDEQRAGVSFTVPASFAKDTNLGKDSMITVEEYTKKDECQAQNFFDKNSMIGEEARIVVGDTPVTFAQAADAGAGNRYEEFVVAFPGDVCRGVRLFVHSLALGNFDPDTVHAFDRDQLMAWYVAMVASYQTR